MSHSITRWIPGLRTANPEAAQQLWNHFSDRLIELARRKLRHSPKRVADEEDLASTVFYSLCRGAAAGRLVHLESRDELWWVLLAITRRKIADLARHEVAQKRGSGQVQCETAVAASSDQPGFTLDDLIADEPTAELLVMLQEEHLRLLSLLRDDVLRQIAQLRIEGYSLDEIAQLVDISKRSVERKLNLIRTTWAKELDLVF